MPNPDPRSGQQAQRLGTCMRSEGMRKLQQARVHSCRGGGVRRGLREPYIHQVTTAAGCLRACRGSIAVVWWQ